MNVVIHIKEWSQWHKCSRQNAESMLHSISVIILQHYFPHVTSF